MKRGVVLTRHAHLTFPQTVSSHIAFNDFVKDLETCNDFGTTDTILSSGRFAREVDMQKARKILGGMLIAIAGLVMAGFNNCNNGPTSPPLNSLTLLPTNANPSCTVAAATFNTWFVSNSVSANGSVNPANSVTFPNSPNCSFYQWAMQDFLWLTSPTTSAYGGKGLILDSPAFFDVSPPAGSEVGPRTLLPHTAGFIHPLVLRAAQAGPQGLQLTFDSSGTPIQVKLAEKGAVPTVINAAGQRIQVAHAKLGRDGNPILLDGNGAVIRVALTKGIRPQAKSAEIPTMLVATKFIVDRIPIFIDPSLSVIDVEQGEADTNGVLEAQSSQGGSLIYYATIVNDVYAYYATGVKDGAISLTGDGICTPSAGSFCFPTTGTQLSQIQSFATGHTTFPDATALAIEVKSAWVVATGLPNLGSYVTMNATIPTYNPPVPPPSGTTALTATGQQTVQLALVGMHVVGSAAGHPEMIWSTFEHVNNAPAGTYSYINTSNATAQVNQNVSQVPTIGGSSAPWLLSSTSATSFNTQNMSVNAFSSPATITANGPPAPGTILPSDTIRWKAFGAASDVVPNPADPSTAASNTEIIAINNSIQSMLASGDLRANYILTGATWTVNGFAPIGGGASQALCAKIPPPNGCPVGTSALSNTTMETYDQGKDNTLGNGGLNCLSCHSGGNTTVVSHIFGGIKPLF
jgi:hypothetical protein